MLTVFYFTVSHRGSISLSQYMADPEERIEGLRYVQKSMTDTDFIDADIEKAEQDLERLSGMV